MDEEVKQQTLIKIKEILEKTGRTLICEICGSTNWTVSGIVSMSLQPNIGVGMVIGGPTLSMAPLVCRMCGNTKLLNLIALGVVKQGQPLNDVADRIIQDALGGENQWRG